MWKLLAVGLLGLMGCAGRTGAGYFPVSRSTTYAPRSPESPNGIAAPRSSVVSDAVAPDSTSRFVLPPVARQPLTRSYRAPVNASRRPAATATRLGRTVAHRLLRHAARHAPTSHALNGLGTALLLVLLGLGTLTLLIVLAATMPGTPVGIVALSILLAAALALVLLLVFNSG